VAGTNDAYSDVMAESTSPGDPRDTGAVDGDAPADSPPADSPPAGAEGGKGAGDSAAGDSAAGDSAAGDSAAGDSAAGDSAAGDSAAGDSAAGDSAAGDSAAGGGGGGGGGRRWWRDPLLAAATVVCVLAAGFAGWSGWSWASAATAGAPPLAQVRDQALQAGEQAVQNFNTLDYRHVNQGLALWEQSSAGALHAEIATGRAQFAQEIKSAKTITTARVLDAALTSLNDKAGTATIIAAVQITVTPAGGGTPAVKQSRLLGTLTRTPSGWKLSALSQAPVGAAAGTGGSGGGKTPGG
jgi:Mce-associated membrane protein